MDWVGWVEIERKSQLTFMSKPPGRVVSVMGGSWLPCLKRA